MESVQVNAKTPVHGTVKLNVESIIEKNGELNIKLSDNMCYCINPGDKLFFRRTIYHMGNTVTFEEFVLVKSEDSDHVLHTTLLSDKKTQLYNNFFEFKYDENTSYNIIRCSEPHYLFGQDLTACNNKQEIYFKKYDGTFLGTCKLIKPFHMYRRNELVKEDCLTSSDFEKTCGKPYDYIEIKHYNFLPDCGTEDSFILGDFNEIECGEADYFETKFNPYYYYTIEMNFPNEQEGGDVERGGEIPIEDGLAPSELDDYGNPIRHCHLYGDVWFGSFQNIESVKYVNDGPSYSDIVLDMDYYSLSVGISSDSNEVGLGNEDSFSEQFAKNIEDSLIPDFIDMERVKYVPYGRVYTGSSLTSITIYPHFRRRELVDLDNNTNTFSTSGNLYSDGWYIDEDNSYNVYWNGYNGDGSLASISEFINQSGTTSDLIGFLNFTDNDVYYRKHKVSKSFFRFSFYDSNDPIEQKLLYYSTVFLDSGELFSKFLKQSSFIQDNPESAITNSINDNGNGVVKNENVKVVFCENKEVGSRVDSTILLTNEYNRTKSSEGFNLYLFADDAPEGNEEKTIYMKVDFNHAGNGTTIPMIVMPTDVKLTMENFFEYLFIPVKIRKHNGVYTYRIMRATDYSNGNADLCLFEPKLEIE